MRQLGCILDRKKKENLPWSRVFATLKGGEYIGAMLSFSRLSALMYSPFNDSSLAGGKFWIC